MRPAYAERLQLHEPPMVHGLIDHPWLAENDTLFHLDPPDGNLQWLYVFANPDDAHGYENLDEVGQAVVRCLDRLAEENVGSVAFLHIPLSRDGNFPTAENNDESALALVEALRAWDEGNPERITDVLLVDLSGDFDRVLH